MSISYGINNLLDPDFSRRPGQPVGVPSRKVGPRSRQAYTGDVLLNVWGQLWLEAEEVRLYDDDLKQFLVLDDPDACQILRQTLPEEYLGGALFLVWLGLGANGLKLHTAYQANFPDLPPAQGTQGWFHVAIRPMPPGYEAGSR